MNRFICGLAGHDYLRSHAHRRLTLTCADCGHISPGWEITGDPVLKFAGDRRRHRLINPRTVVRIRRKVA